MRIAVIVPALDDAACLAAALPALERRDDVDEIVVVDASRGPGTRAFYEGLDISPSSRLRLVGAPRAGRAVQMNIGAGCVDADVYLFLHADSKLPDVDLRRLLGAVVPDPGWGRFDVRLDDGPWWARMIAAGMNLRSRLSGIATGDQGIFVHRELYRSCGGFPDMPLMEDIEMCRRLKRHGRGACLRARITTSARRWQRHGVWRTIALMWYLRFRYWLGADPARLARIYRDAR